MTDREVRRERLRAGAPFAAGGVTLLPIERAVLYARNGRAGVWLSAAVEPYAVVVRDAGGIRAFAADAAEMSLERLRGQIPELDAMLGLHA